MTILFINPPFKAKYGKYSRESRSPAIAKSGVLYYPLWLLYAAGVVDELGFNVKFIDAPAKCWDNETTIKYIKSMDISPKLIVIGTSTPSIISDVNFGAELKEIYNDSVIALVGTHPSALPDETMALSSKIDCIACHEYDFIIRDLAIALRDQKPLSEVKGLVYRGINGEIIKNPSMPYIDDLDQIPFVSKSIKKFLDVKDYFFAAASYPAIQIFTGRGCPYRCFFCVYPQTMHGHNYRKRSNENIIAEFEYIIKNFKDVKEIVIEDDTFTVSNDNTINFCKLLIEKGINKKIKWLCNSRVSLSYEAMVYMKKAGCQLIIPGIESSNPAILKSIHKGTTIDQIKNYIYNAKKAGLKVHACYMVGNPGETIETMKKTLDMALMFNTDTAQFFPLIPYPGTEAYAWATENGYIHKSFSKYCKEDGTHNCVIDLPGLSSEQLVSFCDNARKRYYLRPRYILHRILSGIKNPEDFKRSFKAFLSIKKYLFNNH